MQAFPYSQTILSQSSYAKNKILKKCDFSLGQNNNCLSSLKSESQNSEPSVSCPSENFSLSSNPDEVGSLNNEDFLLNSHNQQQDSRNNNNLSQPPAYSSVISRKIDNVDPYIHFSNNQNFSPFPSLPNPVDSNQVVNSYNVPSYLTPPAPPYSKHIEYYTLPVPLTAPSPAPSSAFLPVSLPAPLPVSLPVPLPVYLPVPFDHSHFNHGVTIKPPNFFDALRMPPSDSEAKALLVKNLCFQKKRAHKEENPPKVVNDTIGTQTSRAVAFEESEKIEPKPNNNTLPVKLVGNKSFNNEKDGPYVLVPAKEYIRTNNSTPSVYVLPAILHSVSNENPIEQLMDVVKDFNPGQSKVLSHDLSDFKHITCFPQTNKVFKPQSRYVFPNDSINSLNFLDSHSSLTNYLLGKDDLFPNLKNNVSESSSEKVSKNSFCKSDDFFKKEKLHKKTSILKKSPFHDENDKSDKENSYSPKVNSLSTLSSNNQSLSSQKSSSTQSNQSIKNADPNSSSNNGAYDYYYPNHHYRSFDIF